MALHLDIHPANPQPRLLKQAAQWLNDGGLVAVPTDSSYAVVARLDDKNAADGLRRLRGLDDRHHLTLRLFLETGMQESFWFEMAMAGVQVNLVLMALNLLPIPPLDGGRILFSLLPNRLAWQYSKIEPYGLVIVVVLLVTDVLWILMRPVLALGTAIVQWFL